MEVIGNILTTTRDYADSDECTGITHLIRRVNISHGRILLETKGLGRKNARAWIPNQVLPKDAPANSNELA